MLFLLALLSTSFASDGKYYPGSMCVPQYSSYEHHLYYSRWFSDESSAILVDCPVVRDETGSSVGNSAIYVVDNSSKDDVSCTLAYQSFTGSSGGWSSTAATTSSRDSSTPTTLSTGAVSKVSSAFLYFSCEVAGTSSGDSGISGYYVSEG